MIDTHTKTPIHIVRGRKRTPAFMNGDPEERRSAHVQKVQVYFFDAAGELVVRLIPLRMVERARQMELGL